MKKIVILYILFITSINIVKAQKFINEHLKEETIILVGNTYCSSLGPNEPNYQLTFLKDNKVKILLDKKMGSVTVPYFVKNGLIGFTVMQDLSIVLKIINSQQFELIQSTTLNEKQSVKGIYYNLKIK